MSHFLSSCELRDHLRSKEMKINKLKRVLDHLDDLGFFEPRRQQEVEAKNPVVNELIRDTLTEARQLLIHITYECERCNPNPKE